MSQRASILTASPLLVLIAVFGCGSEESPPDPPQDQTPPLSPPLTPPTIDSFVAVPSDIVSGGAAVLRWQATGATSLRLVDPDLGSAFGAGLTVTPTTTTTYTLEAENADGTAAASVILRVVPAIAPPPTPANVRSLSGLTVLWDPVPEASSYAVDRRGPYESNFTSLGSVPASQPVMYDYGGTANAITCFRVRAVNSAGSSPSVESCSLTPPPPPEGPAKTVTPSQITLSRGATTTFATEPVGGTWLIGENIFGGEVTQQGVYTAPASPGRYTIIVLGNSVSAAAIVLVE